MRILITKERERERVELIKFSNRKTLVEEVEWEENFHGELERVFPGLVNGIKVAVVIIEIIVIMLLIDF